MRKTVSCTIVMFLAMNVASAAVIYATNGLARPTSGPDDLIMFDSANPADYVTIGSMGVPDISFGGMDFDREGNLWAYASYRKSTGAIATGLYHVNTTTGEATLQGGTASLLGIQDIAFNPVNNKMYGIYTRGTTARMYTIDLTTGEVRLRGTITGLPTEKMLMGFAIDSQGNYYVHDITSDKIYKGAGLAMTELCTIPCDTDYSQGMTIDWSRDDMGYHNAVGQAVSPHHFSQLGTFTTAGNYVLGPDFGPELPDELPPVECGDLAIMPIPEPASFMLLAFAALLRRR